MALNSGSRFITLTMGAAAAVFVVFIMIYPDKAFNASLYGLTLWWKIVFPALLPFLVASEIMIAYGFAHFLGVLTEPAMQWLFKLPGISGWAAAVGLTAGYPAGADVTAKLRNQGLISRNEGERLLCISHLSNPVFVMSVVAVGFFHNPALGLIVLSIHYLSAFVVGLLTRIYSSDNKSNPVVQEPNKTSIINRCFQAMEKARFEDGRSFGKLLGDGVSSSIQTLLMIGGYIIIFSVILQVLTLSLPLESFKHILTGFFEINLGAYAISQFLDQSPIIWKCAVLGSILAWSGLS
ncbi:MAG TPA: nucleoside recognition domain-containing protein, partial [Bacilli bacterium]